MQRKCISGFVSLVGSLGWVLHIYGIPSYVENAATWLRWFSIVQEWPPAAYLFPTLFLGGPVLWTSGWWYPRLRRPLKGNQSPCLRSTRLADWLARDGSITLKQAAFLWLGVHYQNPAPPVVQDRIAIFRNAIEQGTLKRHMRHNEETESNLALLRLLISNPTPEDTRIMPDELRRWAAESSGHVPEFLDE